nr:MAG TPA: hypothetical protein [Caudoviricetes sp.]
MRRKREKPDLQTIICGPGFLLYYSQQVAT